MSNDFRILNEITINFKSNKLYIMLLRELGMFGVEVASKSDGYGRKFTEDKIKATELFESIANKLKKTNNFDIAEEKIKSYFSLKDINEIMFLLKSEGIIRTQSSIGELYDSFKFKAKPKYNYKGDIKNKGFLTIYIFFRNKKKPIGRFIGERFGNEFIFERL